MNWMANATHSRAGANDPWQTHTVEIAGIQREIEGVATYDLAFKDPDVSRQFRFSPGQFNMIYLPGAGEDELWATHAVEQVEDVPDHSTN